MNVVNKTRAVIAGGNLPARGTHAKVEHAPSKESVEICWSLFAFPEVGNGSRGFPSEFTGDSYSIQSVDKLTRKDKDGDTRKHPRDPPVLSG